MDSELRTSQDILARCAAQGFALAGICRAEPTQYEQELLAWLAAGKHGEMEYLNRNVDLRIDPSNMVPGAQSIILVADRYVTDISETPTELNRARSLPQRPLGRIARYARGEDYHKVMRKRLASMCDELKRVHPEHVFRACVDTAPVLEREHAQRAGLGAIGKNTLLLQRGVGSYLLLGEIITTLALTTSTPSDPDPCGTCTRCIDACPTGAIAPWSVDATRCISYLTIEHRGTIDEKYHAAMGDWIFGCDVCQEVCPHNQPTLRTRQSPAHRAYAARREGFDLLEVLHWDEQARRDAFAKSSMKRARLNMMKRNALIAAANALMVQAHPALEARIRELACAADEDPIVRETALQSLQRLEAFRGLPEAGGSKCTPASSCVTRRAAS